MRRPGCRVFSLVIAVVAGAAAASPQPLWAQAEPLPAYLKDRGTGIPSSIFGAYISHGEFLVFPFGEYIRDHNREYDPSEFGTGPAADFRGRYRSRAGQIFLGYGVTDWLALELEAAYLDATLDKSPTDLSATPARIEESGITDIEGQLRFRLMKESHRRPEIFGYVELTAKSQRNKLLIGEPDWDLRPGIGVVRGFGWGTMTFRITAEYNREESHPILGEVGIEYLRQVSPSIRLNLAVEGGEGGAPDEFDFIAGVRWRLKDGVFLKFDNALGITSKATDWAPQLGVMLSFRRRG